MTTIWTKSKKQADANMEAISLNYDHVEIVKDPEFPDSIQIAYCCPKNVALRTLHNKLGDRCIKTIHIA